MKRLIVNADDLGASGGINRGIFECHTRGIVTSASLLVDGRAARDAASVCRDMPRLAIGLHWDVWGEGERAFDIDDGPAVRDELERQLTRFVDLTGAPPTHLDSHRHAHLKSKRLDVFEECAAGLGIPLRGSSPVRFVGHFYAQWEWLVTELEHVGVDAMVRLIRTEVHDGWTEFSCHPGFVSEDFESIYRTEREAEVRTLTDGHLSEVLAECNVELASFAEFLADRAPV